MQWTLEQIKKCGHCPTEHLSLLPGKLYRGRLFLIQVEEQPDSSEGKDSQRISLWVHDDEIWFYRTSFSAYWTDELRELLMLATGADSFIDSENSAQVFRLKPLSGGFGELWSPVDDAIRQLLWLGRRAHNLADKARGTKLWAEQLKDDLEYLNFSLRRVRDFYLLDATGDYDVLAAATFKMPHPKHPMDPWYQAYRNMIKLSEYASERRNLAALSDNGQTWGYRFIEQLKALHAALESIKDELESGLETGQLTRALWRQKLLGH